MVKHDVYDLILDQFSKPSKRILFSGTVSCAGKWMDHGNEGILGNGRSTDALVNRADAETT